MKRAFAVWYEQLLSDIFESAEHVWKFSLPELARRSKLTNSTVYRYYHRQVEHPRLRSVFKMCRAVGMDMEIVKDELALAMAKAGRRRKAA